jgi:hypothetical protein
MGGTPKIPKQLRTNLTCHIHYFIFVLALQFTDDLLLETTVPIKCCNFQLALYAMHLATGSTTKCRSLKSVTIKKYLLTITQFLAQISPHDTWASLVASILPNGPSPTTDVTSATLT